MSHWAEINQDNIVLRVVVGDNNAPDEGQAFVESLGGTWVKTSYNANIRDRFAGIGMRYDQKADVFVKVFPASPPNDGQLWEWESDEVGWVLSATDEQAGDLVEVTDETF
jgi:hypothetical protein